MLNSQYFKAKNVVILFIYINLISWHIPRNKYCLALSQSVDAQQIDTPYENSILKCKQTKNQSLEKKFEIL